MICNGEWTVLSCKYCISIHHIKGYMITQDVVGYDHNQRALSSLGDTESEVCSLPLLTVTPSPPVHNIRQHMKNVTTHGTLTAAPSRDSNGLIVRLV